jgi:hypothetical protein
MLISFLTWAVIGALTHFLTVEEDTGPWWLTAAVVLSWPIFLLAHFTPVHLEIGIYEAPEGDDE